MLTQTITVEELLAYAIARARVDALELQPPPFDQWLDTCPVCGGVLYVVEYTRVDGSRIQDRSVLESDGFEVCMDQLDSGSTMDEVVQCATCHVMYDLSDLTLEDQ